MHKIKTRKKARIQNQIDKCICVLFVLIAILGGGFDFMMWYFTMTVPDWIFAVGMLSAVALIMLSLAWWEALEKEANRFWWQS